MKTTREDDFVIAKHFGYTPTAWLNYLTETGRCWCRANYRDEAFREKLDRKHKAAKRNVK